MLKLGQIIEVTNTYPCEGGETVTHDRFRYVSNDPEGLDTVFQSVSAPDVLNRIPTADALRYLEVIGARLLTADELTVVVTEDREGYRRAQVMTGTGDDLCELTQSRMFSDEPERRINWWSGGDKFYRTPAGARRFAQALQMLADTADEWAAEEAFDGPQG